MPAEEVPPDARSERIASPPAGAAAPAIPKTAAVGAGSRLPLWVVTLGVGLVAGAISWAGGEATFDWFKLGDAIIYPANYNQISGYHRMAVQAELHGKARIVVERKKTALAFGLLGLLLGVSLGLTGGLARGGSHSALAGAVGGGVAGAAAGGGLSFALVPLFFRYEDPEGGGLLVLFLTHAGIFAGIGAASGLALGLGLNDRTALSRALFGGLLGALIGTVAYEAAIATAFPLMRTYEPLSTERLPRLLAHLLVAACTALFAGLATGRPPRQPAPTAMVPRAIPQ
jgi:hypothetical protein